MRGPDVTTDNPEVDREAPAVSDRRIPALDSLLYLTVTSFISACAAALYAIAHTEPSPSAALFLFYAPSVALILWLQADSRRSKVASSIQDWGFFLWLAWPLVLPWYVLKSRGTPGWGLLVRLYLLALAPYLIVFAIWTIIGTLRQG